MAGAGSKWLQPTSMPPFLLEKKKTKGDIESKRFIKAKAHTQGVVTGFLFVPTELEIRILIRNIH